MSVQCYVDGLVFNNDATWVLLIRKNRPPWQAGKLNGIGGHVESGESIPLAMEREFEEEAGIYVPMADWNWFMELNVPNRAEIHFFSLFDDHTYETAMAMTDEKLVRVKVTDIAFADVIPNLKWIIPLAAQDELKSFEVTEKE